MRHRSPLTCLVALAMTMVATDAVAGGVLSSAGAGAGQNYGGVGLNASRVFGGHVAAVAGAGYLDVERIGWGAGVQVHAALEAPAVLARVTALYGTTHALYASQSGGGGFQELDHGVSIGPGLLARVGSKWWVAGDLFYKVSGPPAGYTDEGSRLCGALGVLYGAW